MLLEDNLILGETIHEMLLENGYEVDWVIDGQAACDATFENGYNLYIFDINVPEINGFDLVEQLRGADDLTPTIFISAMSDMAALSKGFKVGADDYIKKPFYPEELLLRIEARFLRKESPVSYGKISYNPQNNEVKKDGKLLSLGDVQLPFLRLFITNIGRTLSKESLFDLMEHPSDSALRVAINKLKSTTEWEIQNIRSVGYRIEKS
ncbi:MAG: response regulator transcription factor [Sulfurimonas sp.]|uniref:response regulator transcription factor n=1 Tax=Sulfurimonas sp. TaxID=2022749 RepID=UPI002615918A|nr:response regulator transcription factor [Sulfurimonas sp.]MDD3855566.1 response regulator transcription factor [Sulfurimonas sp.]